METTPKIQTEGDSLSGLYPDWTRILAETGLEAPGYHEAVQAAREATAEKREQERLAREEKQAQQRRKRIPKTA